MSLAGDAYPFIPSGLINSADPVVFYSKDEAESHLFNISGFTKSQLYTLAVPKSTSLGFPLFITTMFSGYVL